jgi:hypothetical protein
MSEIKRGAGFCAQPNCRDHARLRLVEPFHTDFVCSSCAEPGHVEPEFGASLGPTSAFSEVRVYYAYDPRERGYPCVAVARDPGVLGPSGAYTLFSPVVHSEGRAQRLAEKLLARLNGRSEHASPARTRRDSLIAEGWQVLA